jgi:hypothetical protein
MKYLHEVNDIVFSEPTVTDDAILEIMSDTFNVYIICI